jgi:iron complex outermembrane receptor protein
MRTRTAQATRRTGDACRRGLAATFAGAVALADEAVPAQQGDAAVVKPDRVEVTGAHIARFEGESGLPAQGITREELQHGGVQTVQELVERISASQSATRGHRDLARARATTCGLAVRRTGPSDRRGR